MSFFKEGENKFLFGDYELKIYFHKKFIFNPFVVEITWHRKNGDEIDSYSSSSESFNVLLAFQRAYKHLKEMEANASE